MENPNTRPYTAEELEVLLKEEVANNDIPKNNKGSKRLPNQVILQDITLPPTEVRADEIRNMHSESRVDNVTETSKLKTYAPFIILGVILTGVGIYLYYDYRKRKETEKMQKPKKE